MDIFGKDSLMKTSLPYYLLAVLSLLGLLLDDADPFPFIVLIYAGFPIIDEIFSFDERNPDVSERAQLERD